MSQKLKKISDWLTIATVFLLPFQTRYIIEAGQLNNGPYEYTTIALYATDLLILAALLFTCLGIFLSKQKSGQILHRRFWLLSIALLFFNCLSIFTASDRLVTLYVWSRLLIGLILAWLIIYSRLNFKKIIITILASTFLQSLLAIWQFFIQHTWSNKWLGLAAHYPVNLGASVVETATVPIERWLRAYGSLDHPNLLGAWLGLGLIIATYLYIDNHREQKKYGHIILTAITVLTAGLFFSLSRAAILGTGLSLLIIFFTYLKDWRHSLCAFIMIGLVATTLLIPYHPLYQARVSALEGSVVGSRLEVKSLDERASYNQQAWQLIKRHLFWGRGAGNYGLAISQEIIPKQLSYYYQPVHNVFLLIWSETGIFGLLSWLALLGLLFTLIIKNLKNNPLAPLALAILILPFIIMFFDHWLWDLHFGVLFVWLIFGLVIKLNDKYDE